MILNKNKLDVAQILLTYIALVGDVQKTAAALELDPDVVQRLADAEGWDLKIKRVTLMSRSGKPGDFERAQNRALCFVQGHRIRSLVDKVVTRFAAMTDDEICNELTTVGKGGRVISARFFTDLAAAAEKAHGMTYAALGDTATDRSQRENVPDEMNVSALHAAVIASLNAPGASTKPADQIVRELAAEVDAQIATQSVVVSERDTQPVVVSDSGTERTDREPRPISGTPPAQEVG